MDGDEVTEVGGAFAISDFIGQEFDSEINPVMAESQWSWASIWVIYTDFFDLVRTLEGLFWIS